MSDEIQCPCGHDLVSPETPADRVAEVLTALAEGVSIGAATRIFGHSEFTLRTWPQTPRRAGLQATTLHEHFFCSLKLLQVQLDEICTKTRQSAEHLWVWSALGAPTKLIPVLKLGPRTQATAHAVVHALAELYFYALTAHFGDWVTPLGQRTHH
ncbi:MAG: helix-turn-helix domain-containing protein [Anaerolineales bacterium]|nr:helix-turn-helix domain-containing protein [Anaerolineales bacterium]